MTAQLAIKSYYSLMESALSVNDIVQSALNSKATSVALADHNVMYGAIAFYRACKKNHLKPILGLNADVTFNGETQALLLLARNNQGYKKLVELSTILNTEKRTLTLEDFEDSSHLYVIMSGPKSFLEQAIINSDTTTLDRLLKRFKAVFAHFMVGMDKNEEAFWHNKNQYLKQIARQNGIPTVVAIETCYLNKTDDQLCKALWALQKKTNINDASISGYKNLHFHSADEMLYLYDEEDILMTEEVANDCNVDIDEEHCQLLHYPNEANAESSVYLARLCEVGLAKRFKGLRVPNNYAQRLQYELSVIHKMGYDDYFLIVYDFIRFARSKQIYVGPGRGSAAGSIVAWTLGITHIDPIANNLLFERFLNPERISMPDIDVDFPDERREEVIQYVTEKYGEDHIAHIIAFSTLQAKAALDNAAEAYHVDKRKLDYIKKYLPKVVTDKSTSQLNKTYQTSERFRQQINADEDLQKVYQLALKLEGMPKNITTHACGIVMSNKSLTEVIPMTKVDDGLWSTQISAEYLEDLGLLKMDFLGIRNLTIIDHVCNSIEEKIDILKIPTNDSETFKLLGNGDTVGIFQLESEGIKNLCRRLKPRNLNEISDVLALYRPGSMEGIDTYLANRQNPKNIRYLHPDLKPILESTYGMIVYQEQIMQIAQVAAGFTLGKADLLRRAMSKKKEKELLALKDEFIQGCINNHYPVQTANQLYELILPFANYGFNKSHSAAYSLVAYQMAYLKTRYPLHFLSALLNNVIGAENKTYEYLQEANKLHVKVSPLSINYSEDIFTIEEDSIRLPLTCIKKIGRSIVNTIQQERSRRGYFKDFYDFVARLNAVKIPRSIMEALIQAGACDCFKVNRASMLASLDEAMQYAELIKVENPEQTVLDFDLVYKPNMMLVKEDGYQRLMNEQEVLGFYLSKHPIEYVKNQANYAGPSIKALQANTRANVLVHILKIKNHVAKTGNMAFVTVDDETGSLDVVVLPTYYERYRDLLEKGNFVLISGRVEEGRSESLSFVAEKVTLVKSSQ